MRATQQSHSKHSVLQFQRDDRLLLCIMLGPAVNYTELFYSV